MKIRQNISEFSSRNRTDFLAPSFPPLYSLIYLDDEIECWHTNLVVLAGHHQPQPIEWGSKFCGNLYFRIISLQALDSLFNMSQHACWKPSFQKVAFARRPWDRSVAYSRMDSTQLEISLPLIDRNFLTHKEDNLHKLHSNEIRTFGVSSE